MNWTPCKLVLGLGLAVLCGGCAGGASYKEAMGQAPALSREQGRIFIYRDGGFVGSAIQPHVQVNEKEVCKSVPGGFIYLDLPAGNYVVGCASEGFQALSLTLSPQETRYVRTVISMGLGIGHVSPIMEDEKTAMKTLEGCHHMETK
jgi:hypothetical protein